MDGVGGFVSGGKQRPIRKKRRARKEKTRRSARRRY